MLDIKGQNIIDGLPIEDLKLVNTILSFEDDPMLNHYQDGKVNDWIGYWVDSSPEGKRWLLGKITKHELYLYLSGARSLKVLFSEISSDYLFLVDYDLNEKITTVRLINSYSIPPTYFPGSNSFFKWGLDDFYSQYLDSFSYIDKLREKAFIITVEPSNRIHEGAVTARDAAFVLSNYAKSIENYVDVTAFNLIVEEKKTGDRAKINKRVKAIKNKFTPVISQTNYKCFEVWLSIDTVILSMETPKEIEWRNNLIENFKNDVLDIDITNQVDAKIIEEKFNKDEREKIFTPIIKVLENEDIFVSVRNYSGTFNKDYGTKRITSEFRDIILPPPTVEELRAKIEAKDKLVTAIVRLKGGKDVSEVRATEIKHGIVFTEETTTGYPIESVEIDGKTIHFRKPIRCEMSLSDEGNFVLSHTELELYAENKDLEPASEEIKAQLTSLISAINSHQELPGERKIEYLKNVL
jgi:hypothetical protein